MLTLFRPALSNQPQVFAAPGGFLGALALRLEFATAPTGGTVTIEGRREGSAVWLPMMVGASLGEPLQFLTDGGYSAFRLTFSGLQGGVAPVLAVIMGQTATPPSFLLTDGGFGPAARLRVDPGATGFFARRTWELSWEFTTLGDVPLTFRFIIPCNFIVTHSALSVDQGGVTWRTYSEAQGVPSGNFATEYPLLSTNTMDEQEPYDFMSSVAYGGAFTPGAEQHAITTLRVRTAGSTAQQSSIGGSAVQEKGRAAGIYYGELKRMTGVNGDCKGVLNIVIEERPS